MKAWGGFSVLSQFKICKISTIGFETEIKTNMNERELLLEFKSLKPNLHLSH